MIVYLPINYLLNHCWLLYTGIILYKYFLELIHQKDTKNNNCKTFDSSKMLEW